jgi:hypothetical protein
MSTESDLHLLAAPFRWIQGWLKTLLFIAILPVVFIISLIYSAITGEPIMSMDECILAQYALTILNPFIVTILFVIYRHIHEKDESVGRGQLNGMLVFFLDIPCVLLFCCINNALDLGFFRDGPWNNVGPFWSLSPLWIPLVIFTFFMWGNIPPKSIETILKESDDDGVGDFPANALNFNAVPLIDCLWCGRNVPCIGLLGHNSDDKRKIVAYHAPTCTWPRQAIKRLGFYD